MIILLGSAGVSFALAILEDGEGMTAFVDPAVVSAPPFFYFFTSPLVIVLRIFLSDPHYPCPERGCWRLPRKQCREGDCCA